MKHKTPAAITALLIALTNNTFACDAHKIPVSPSTWKNNITSAAGINAQFSEYDRPSSGGDEFKSSIIQFGLSQKISDKWTIQLGVPYLDRELNGEQESGIGDATAVAVYQAYRRERNKHTLTLDIYGGIKMPTGDSDRLKDESSDTEEHHEAHAHGMAVFGHSPTGDSSGDHHADDHDAHSGGHHLALGSGSWDGIFGAIIRARQGSWTALLDAQYILRTEGDHDFKYGDETYVRGGVFCDILQGRNRLAAGAVASGEWRDANEVNGEKSGDRKSAAYVGPALHLGIGELILVTAAYDFPVHNRDEGLDGAADQRVRVGLSVYF